MFSLKCALPIDNIEQTIRDFLQNLRVLSHSRLSDVSILFQTPKTSIQSQKSLRNVGMRFFPIVRNDVVKWEICLGSLSISAAMARLAKLFALVSAVPALAGPGARRAFAPAGPPFRAGFPQSAATDLRARGPG